MKKTLFLAFAGIAFVTAGSQTLTDTVSIGAGYSSQTWYSLQNNEQGTAPKSNWDIAFQCSGQGSSILINSATGTKLWLYPGSDTSGWATLDTAGLSAWPARYNSDTSWAYGAFSILRNAGNPYDLGWGIYSTITHFVTGDSLFVIKLANGAYKKIWVKQLASSVYTFRYANLNGTGDTTVSFAKSNYSGKNFGYYSLQNNAALDREPLSANWDLAFTQYTAFIPNPYTVSGVLSNKGVKTAQVYPVDTANIPSWPAQTFSGEINTIGYDWKVYSGNWVIEDSLVYFVKTNTGDVWKVIFTGFGGSANGNYIFSKQQVSATGISGINSSSPGTLSVYPNPSGGGIVTVICTFESPASAAVLKVFDLTGKPVFSENLKTDTGLNTCMLRTSSLSAGIYFVTVEFDGNRLQQKLIVR